jgi:hypothetical protein
VTDEFRLAANETPQSVWIPVHSHSCSFILMKMKIKSIHLLTLIRNCSNKKFSYPSKRIHEWNPVISCPFL